MRIIVNRQTREVADGATVAQLLRQLQVDGRWVAVAVGGEIVPRERWDTQRLAPDMQVEVVTAMAGGEQDALSIGGLTTASRLFVGTGKYPDMEVMRASLRESGTGLVTVSVRYFGEDSAQPILPKLELDRYALLPNTAGAKTVEQALHMARLGRELTGTSLVKLEIIGDDRTLWPDTAASIDATRRLVAEGFTVLVYTSPDLVAALRLEDAGASAVMPLAAPIGSGQGLLDWDGVARIIARIGAPVVVDAGIGVPSDAAQAMEMGADAVLVNTAIARARDPVLMARAMRMAVQAGRMSLHAGRIPKQAAAPSSPTDGVPERGA